MHCLFPHLSFLLREICPRVSRLPFPCLPVCDLNFDRAYLIPCLNRPHSTRALSAPNTPSPPPHPLGSPPNQSIENLCAFQLPYLRLVRCYHYTSYLHFILLLVACLPFFAAFRACPHHLFCLFLQCSGRWCGSSRDHDLPVHSFGICLRGARRHRRRLSGLPAALARPDGARGAGAAADEQPGADARPPRPQPVPAQRAAGADPQAATGATSPTVADAAAIAGPAGGPVFAGSSNPATTTPNA